MFAVWRPALRDCSMPGNLPLNGSDYLMLGFDYELRRQGYPGNSCQIVLELDRKISADALRQRLNFLVQRYPILASRPVGWFTPHWKSVSSVASVPSVRVHSSAFQSFEPLLLKHG